MRKILATALVSAVLLWSIPGTAMAGDTHAVSNRWTGVAIGASAAIVGGLLLNALQAPWASPPTAIAPPPVAYAPPPVVYTPPPVVYYTPPAVVYKSAPVVVHRGWGPPARWRAEHREYRHGWEHR
jgi:hypothetical protein